MSTVTTVETVHPLQKQIDAVVADVRSGECDLSTVQWRLQQAIMSAEIEIQALSILDQCAMLPTPVSTNEQVMALINKQIELAEQGRRKAAAGTQSEDRATRNEAYFDLRYHVGGIRALEALRTEIEVRALAIVAEASQ
jgi:hypothetical protein